METQLDNLIQKIRQEGVEEAKKKSKEIIKDAERRAEEIIEDAERKKAAIMKDGQRDTANLRKSGEEVLRQASRDIILSLRQRIVELFDSVLKKDVSEGLSSENLKKIITRIIENFKKDEGLDIEILLSKQDKKGLEEALLRSLKDEFRKGITFKVSSGIEKGFRIGEKDKNFYYDFTDDAITEALKLYLNPRITDILRLK